MTVHISFRNVIHTAEETGNIVTATTDVQSHLWLRLTHLEPWIHKKPVLRRGMWLNDDVRFCFDVYHDIEQDQDGDTIEHTFTISPCESNFQFWYYLWGYVAEVLSPSTSAILEYKTGLICPDILVFTTDALYDNRTIYESNAAWAPAHDAATGTILDYHADPFFVCVSAVYQTFTDFRIWRGYLQFGNTIPVGSTIIDALIVLFCDSVVNTSREDWDDIIATPGLQHIPVIPTDFGDQLPETTELGRVDLDDCPIGNVTVINLNEAGKNHIVCGGLTRFCIRQEMDVANIFPTLGGAVLQWNSAQAEYWQVPKLVIRYSPPPPP